MQKYFSILTDTGLKEFSDAAVNNTKVNFVNFVYGDGGGKAVIPIASQTNLVNQVGSIKINAIKQNEKSPNIIEVSAVIPATEGGYTIREIGIENEKGKLIAVGNMPDTPKVIITEGICSELELVMQIAVVRGDCVNLQIDPHIITATKADLEKLYKIIMEHINNREIHNYSAKPDNPENLGNFDYGAFTGEEIISLAFDCGAFEGEETVNSALDCGIFEGSEENVLKHEENPYAHREMIIDGNSDYIPDQSQNYSQHEINPYAHQNLNMDGGDIGKISSANTMSETDFSEHKINLNTHENLIIDGGNI